MAVILLSVILHLLLSNYSIGQLSRSPIPRSTDAYAERRAAHVIDADFGDPSFLLPNYALCRCQLKSHPVLFAPRSTES